MMNEPKYLEMIRQGVVNINGDDFKIIRAYDGCRGAGGHILRKISE